MDQQSTPFDVDDELGTRCWTLAGSDSNGIVYAASIDEILLSVNLWAYSGAKGTWKLLATYNQASPPADYGRYVPLVSAAYSERLGRVDVFVECREAWQPGTYAFLFRFLTGPPARLECVVVATNNEDIQFDGSTGPSMDYLGNDLVIIGAMQQTFHLRVFRVDLNFDGHTLPSSYTLTQVWMGLILGTMFKCIYCAAIGDNFIISTGNRFHIFGPAQRWSDPIMVQNPWVSRAQLHLAVCASPNSEDRIWLFPCRNGVIEASILDGQLLVCRTVKWASEVSLYDACPMRVAAASSTHLFWVQDAGNADGREEPKLKSKMFEPPSLEYACLSKLCSWVAAFKKCETEEEGKKLGIPVLTWRRYCR